jgi:hypothetical protein
VACRGIDHRSASLGSKSGSREHSAKDPISKCKVFVDEACKRTWGGPRIVPFQLDISMSSPSARPYEHASMNDQG